MRELRVGGFRLQYPDHWSFAEEEGRFCFRWESRENGAGALLGLEVGSARGDLHLGAACQLRLAGLQYAAEGAGLDGRDFESRAAATAEAIARSVETGEWPFAMDDVQFGTFRGFAGEVLSEGIGERVWVVRGGRDLVLVVHLTVTPGSHLAEAKVLVDTILGTLGPVDEGLPYGLDRLGPLRRRFFLWLVRRELRRQGVKSRIIGGTIHVEGRRIEFGLDNLARECGTEPWWTWPGVVSRYSAWWGRTVSGESPIRRLAESGWALQRLRLRLYPAGWIETIPDVLHRVDLPGTVTAVVLDLEEEFIGFREPWLGTAGITREECFAAARANMSVGDLVAARQELGSGVPAVSYMNDTYGSDAAICLDEATAGIGRFGALVMVPTRALCLCVPLEDDRPLRGLASLAGTTRELASEEAGPVSPDVFWYYEGQFIRCESPADGQPPAVPRGLLLLLQGATS